MLLVLLQLTFVCIWMNFFYHTSRIYTKFFAENRPNWIFFFAFFWKGKPLEANKAKRTQLFALHQTLINLVYNSQLTLLISMFYEHGQYRSFTLHCSSPSLSLPWILNFFYLFLVCHVFHCKWSSTEQKGIVCLFVCISILFRMPRSFRFPPQINVYCLHLACCLFGFGFFFLSFFCSIFIFLPIFCIDTRQTRLVNIDETRPHHSWFGKHIVLYVCLYFQSHSFKSPFFFLNFFLVLFLFIFFPFFFCFLFCVVVAPNFSISPPKINRGNFCFFLFSVCIRFIHTELTN